MRIILIYAEEGEGYKKKEKLRATPGTSTNWK